MPWELLFLAEGAAQQDGSSGFWLTMLTLWLPILAVFYFLFIRPQQRQEAKRRAMLSALKKNDRVVTRGGVIGTVTNVHREAGEVTLRVDDSNNTRMKFRLDAIAAVLSASEEPDDMTKQGDEARG